MRNRTSAVIVIGTTLIGKYPTKYLRTDKGGSMDAGNLKIGNYVYADKEIVKVVAIDTTKDGIELKVSDGELLKGKVSELKITPIKLSMDILQKYCGFDKNGLYVLGIDKDQYYLKFQTEHIALLMENKEPLIHFWDVQHLHQLQNLYYSLKTKDMEIRVKE